MHTKFFSTIFTVFFFGIAATAQDPRGDVFTPNGNPVVAYITSESSDAVRAAYDSVNRTNYPNAKFLETYFNSNSTKKYSSSRRFNCHGYAWHMSTLTDPLSEPRWIGYDFGNTDEYVYWEDSSYIKVTSRMYPGMVSWQGYVNDYEQDHSAVTTIHSDSVISKWRDMPLAKHKIEDSPYGGIGLKYYIKKPSISGPSSICSQATYTIDNLPEGATVQWSVNIPYVTLQPGQDSVIVQKTGSGFINLTASIFINGTLITTIVKEDILVGGVAGLGLSSYSNLQMLDDGSYYKILPSSGAWSYRGSLTVVASGSNLNYSWSETYASSNFIQWSANGSTVDVYSKYDNLNLTLKCTASNSCGSMNRYYSFTTRTNPILPESIILSPNPASDYVDVTVFNEEEGQTEKTTSAVSFKSSPHYQIQLWNSSGLIKTIQTDQPSYQLDLTGVPPGFYYVHVIKDGQTYRRQLVVQ